MKTLGSISRAISTCLPIPSPSYYTVRAIFFIVQRCRLLMIICTNTLVLARGHSQRCVRQFFQRRTPHNRLCRHRFFSFQPELCFWLHFT